MRKKRTQKYNHSTGLVPGTLVYTGQKTKNDFSIDAYKYSSSYIGEKALEKTEDIFNFIDKETTSWININGLNHTEEIKSICSDFNLHSLLQENIVNTQQRPKIELYDNYVFVSLKMLYLKKKSKQIINEQISIVLTKNNVITFQEAEGDVFDDLRERIKEKKGRIRTQGADYLFYSLLDAIVDHYYEVIEVIENKIDDLEAAIFKDNATSQDNTTKIQLLKQDVLSIRKSIFPLRDIINRIQKKESDLITTTTLEYFKDIQDHIVQITENIDLYREMVWNLMDLNISTINTKTNDVMKVLTIVSSIFIPLSFIVGIYGMNFKNMPELNQDNGYFVVLAIMAIIVIAMCIYFKQKKWL